MNNRSKRAYRSYKERKKEVYSRLKESDLWKRFESYVKRRINN